MSEENDSWFIPKIFIGVFFMNVFLFMFFSQGSADYTRIKRDEAISISGKNTDEKISKAKKEINEDFNTRHCQSHFRDNAWCGENK